MAQKSLDEEFKGFQELQKVYTEYLLHEENKKLRSIIKRINKKESPDNDSLSFLEKFLLTTLFRFYKNYCKREKANLPLPTKVSFFVNKKEMEEALTKFAPFLKSLTYPEDLYQILKDCIKKISEVKSIRNILRTDRINEDMSKYFIYIINEKESLFFYKELAELNISKFFDKYNEKISFVFLARFLNMEMDAKFKSSKINRREIRNENTKLRKQLSELEKIYYIYKLWE